MTMCVRSSWLILRKRCSNNIKSFTCVSSSCVDIAVYFIKMCILLKSASITIRCKSLPTIWPIRMMPVNVCFLRTTWNIFCRKLAQVLSLVSLYHQLSYCISWVIYGNNVHLYCFIDNSKCLLCARHSSKCFTFIYSLNPPKWL